MNTSIQIKSETKKQLQYLKKKGDSYEDVIKRMLEKEYKLKEKLEEEYKTKHQELKELNEEWEHADTPWR